jgi:hypothetical protein
MDELDRLFEEQRGAATSSQILQYLTRRGFEAELKTGNLERIWQVSTVGASPRTNCD